MHAVEAIQVKLDKCEECLRNYENCVEEKKNELEQFYKDTYEGRILYGPEGKEIKCVEDGFENIYELARMYIKKQMGFLLKVKDLKIVRQNKFSKQMKLLMLECVSGMESQFSYYDFDNLLYGFSYNIDFAKEYGSILILSHFSSVEENIVLIGGNGSGKSSLAKTLKGNDRENISVIPAQKTLYFSLNDMSMLSTRLKDLEDLLLENNIDKSKTKDDYDYFSFQNNQFTKLIVAMREQYTEYLMECEEKGIVAEKEKSIFGQLRTIYEFLFPEIKLHFKTETSDYLVCEKGNNFYHVNALSEGEKAVLYYSISVLMAKKESFIVVDEPETYLNPSLTNILWDILIEKRKDCQFIFITHSVDFVLGRSDAKIAWIKNFVYPNHWEFEFVKDNFDLPKTMLTEVLGSKKPIMFCEGDSKSSLDYAAYRALFRDRYTIIPVGGHLDVIKYCDVLSKSEWLGIECLGIVDGDNYPENEKKSLKAKGIMVLPFNEIEMFLLSDEVIKHTMETVLPVNAHKKIEEFKKQFWKRAKEKSEQIALKATKIMTDEFVQKQRIEEYDSISSIEHNLSKIAECDVKGIYESSLNKITDIINKENYDELLVICNLKKEISRELANRYLDKDFEDKALQQIMVNQALRKELTNKYFNGHS